ncbi:mechanosensitive ion channel [Chlorogloeopsis sp. ULAP01]|uniref:mechanosensitive ion channel family protein n=1 Tax=Chlorogloeopsis sp. ULAP01 TaxID=3056483 RepID=UPI0025AA4EBF|nr:mechanosensitive ion channel domain-containing protein [Chlorogloeopsis sp. ULAP01]MDM9379343.1 mechanosensitive ion channel [Chlorogloeopsis sp. ULAP01]
MNIVFTLAGIAGIIASFVLLNGLVQFSTKVLAATWFRHHASKITNVRQNATVVLLVACIALCVLVTGVNGVLIFQGKSVSALYLNLLGSIPRQFWIQLAIALFKCISLLLLVKFSLPYLLKALDRACVLAQNSDQITANDESVQVFFSTLKKVSANGIWLLALLFCVDFLQLPDIVIKFLRVGLKAYLAVSLGRLIIKLLSVMIDTLDALSLRFSSSENVLRHYERFRHLVPALKKALEYILYVAIATLVIQDIDSIAWITTYSDEIVQIIGLYFLCGVFIEISNIILEDLVLKTDHLTDLQRQRRLTIIPLFKSVLKYVTYFTGGIIVLNLVGINPAPILAGAGIVGLAVGFGAQNLINDIVCGFFILFENYYLVGDYIEAGKEEERVVEGEVEAIELRTTHIRHPDGQLQIIRNGDIGSIVNYSKHYTYAKVDVPVPPGLELEQVYQLITRVGEHLNNECLDVLEATQIEGLESFDAENLVIRTVTRVKPGKHLRIQRLLRSKLKTAFDQQLAKKIRPG